MDFAQPPGYGSIQMPLKHQTDNQPGTTQLKLKKAWDTALGGIKSIPMNMFIIWMSGNSVQIFSILITSMLLYNPIKSMFQVNELFDRFEDDDAETAKIDYSSDSGISGLLGMSNPFLLPKIAFIAVQFLSLGLGVWKMGSMGLLPTAASDWLAFMEPKVAIEYSFGAI